MADKPMLDHYIDIANEMIEQYRDLRLDQQKMDEVVRLKWQLPDGMPEWARAFRTTVPYDGIKAGVRVLSGLDEHITIDPYAFEENMLGDLVAAKERANLWEIALKWQMDRAARRKDSLRQGVIRSALMYDEIAGQIVHLPTQIKTIQKLGGNPNRQKAALRFGDFAVILRNPQQVYTRYSDYMLEAVMYVSVQDPQRIMDFWNNSELGQVIEDDYCPEDWLLFDYVDYNRRVVFCYPGKNVELISSYKVMEYFDAKGKKYSHDIPAIELLNEEWKFDFLPWAIANGGDGLVDTPEADRFPLLYGLIQSDQWNNTNILGSLVLSEAIAEAARPDVAKIGVNPDMVEGDYGEVGGAWRVPAGHEIKDMQQKSLDPALREAYDRGLSDMRGTSIPQVLVMKPDGTTGHAEVSSGSSSPLEFAQTTDPGVYSIAEQGRESNLKLFVANLDDARSWGRRFDRCSRGFSPHRIDNEGRDVAPLLRVCNTPEENRMSFPWVVGPVGYEVGIVDVPVRTWRQVGTLGCKIPGNSRCHACPRRSLDGCGADDGLHELVFLKEGLNERLA